MRKLFWASRPASELVLSLLAGWLSLSLFSLDEGRRSGEPSQREAELAEAEASSAVPAFPAFPAVPLLILPGR